MFIVVDENIPFGREAFGLLGEVRLVHGRSLDAAAVRDADALIVRSITKVGAKLLDGSRVKFVATATIGTDHVDCEYLAARKIGFASAAGSNANSVSEWFLAALLTLACRGKFGLAGKTVGVVGVGNVGNKVVAKAQALGMRALQNDPPLARTTKDPRFVPLDDLMGADFITCHVPLTRGGPDATWRLFDAGRIAKMRPGAALINSSRGEVVHGSALLAALESGALGGAVLDVWEDEPGIDPALVNRVDLATPHIAGYSFDGKVNGTVMVFEAARAFFGIDVAWDWRRLMPPPKVPMIRVDARDVSPEEAIREAVRACYHIEGDDEALRATMPPAPAERAAAFDRLRRDYPQRREFHNTAVELIETAELRDVFKGIGFKGAGK